MLRRLGGRTINRLIIRLKRKGRLNYPVYELVVTRSQSPSNGFILEKVGFFNPHLSERLLFIDGQRLGLWVNKGAVVHNSVKHILAKFTLVFTNGYK